MSTDFPLLRASLAPQYAGLGAAELDEVVQALYGPEATAEDVEGLFDDIGRGFQNAAKGVGKFAQQAAPVVAGALPSIAQGAATGATFGPWGALIGAATGAAGGILAQSKNKTARQIGGAIHDVGGLVSTVRGGGAGGALGSLASVASGALGATQAGRSVAGALAGGQAGGGAANALMGLLGRPELAQALSSAAMGGFGRTNIPIGGQQVPVNQILAALGTLSQRAAHEAAEYDESAEATPEFATAAEATLGIDADDAEGRTDALLTLLALTPSIWMSQQRQPVNVSVSSPASGGGGTYDVPEQFWLQGEAWHEQEAEYEAALEAADDPYA
ncbi:hypothetical protein SCH01S_01_00370 [Sphingomonas changbaiensis NBRC 104936]|uniref:Uncharacterized protein n=1 Tax=Sphingomonas changbaiensis NBRC 104936 TaxID=1219043 RepID=A0A0E9MK21_9SPHN|nr:hypothetical protein [Sphingomonas changbaiensis]GAO37874.1 hypothetical protein SCH01S_01_00370 [Sphingomonas changbaiensis NBRC 104936]